MDRIGNISKQTFVSMINLTKKFFESVEKFEDKNLNLDPLSEYGCNIIDILERDMGIDFSDAIYEILYCNYDLSNFDGSEIWGMIEEEIKEKDLNESK